MILTLSVTGFSYEIKTCANKDKVDEWNADFDIFYNEVFAPVYRMLAILYGMYALAFCIIGYAFLFLVRRDHNKFYLEYKCMLLGAIAMLTIPLLLRCFLDSLQEFEFW